MRRVAVGILVIESQVLVCQRKRNSRYALKWEFPGGKIEKGESVQECLQRELREELSIEAVVGEQFFKQEWLYPDSGLFEVFYHLVPSFSGTLTNNVFEQVRWVAIDKLREVDMLEGNKEAIALLVSRKSKG